VELVPYLSAVIFIATIATVVLATLSYAAFKLRNRRRPSAAQLAPVYFRRVDPQAGAEAAERKAHP
jgi:hypothetical protein